MAMANEVQRPFRTLPLSRRGALRLLLGLGTALAMGRLPATSKPNHLVDNMRAGFGRLPDAAMRRRMSEHVGRL